MSSDRASSCVADPLQCARKTPNVYLSPVSSGIHRARGTTEPSSATKAVRGASKRGDSAPASRWCVKLHHVRGSFARIQGLLYAVVYDESRHCHAVVANSW